MAKREASRNFFEASFELPNEGLQAYLNQVKKGQSKVWTTPFASGEKTSTMLSEWAKTLVSISDKWPSLWEFENDLAKKVGPMSIMKPLKQRLKDIDSYYDSIKLDQEPISQEAVRLTADEFACLGGLRLRSISSTVGNMKLSTNSGSPYFTKRSRLPVPTDISFWSHKGYWYQEIPQSWGCAAVLGWRGQEGGPKNGDVKQRVVWMFPFALNIAELQMYQPAIELVQRRNVVPAWVSLESVDAEVTRLFDTKGKHDPIICTDFSKFDQHFNAVMQDAARSVIAECTGTREIARWLDEVFPIKFEIPLVTGWGDVRFGKHGMGSGSGGTNFDETLTHRALQYEAALAMDVELNPHSMCLGDDGILSYHGCNVNAVVDTYSRHGLEMNLDKQYASTQDCVYLRRWHHQHYRANGVCVGVYSTMRALGRLRYLERFMDPEVWGPKSVALRQLSILENVKWHPLREEFVRFCMKRDKYRLGLDIPHFLDDIAVEAKKVTANMPDFLGYVRTLQSGSDPTGGIRDWWIVNYLKSLR